MLTFPFEIKPVDVYISRQFEFGLKDFLYLIPFFFSVCFGWNWKVFIKVVCGGLGWSCQMLIPTSHLQLALSTKFIIQMLMKCELPNFDIETYYIGSYYGYGLIFLWARLLRLIYMFMNCRSGSVCLDVINQTWSPMFGRKLLCGIIMLSVLLYILWWSGGLFFVEL